MTSEVLRTAIDTAGYQRVESSVGSATRSEGVGPRNTRLLQYHRAIHLQ